MNKLRFICFILSGTIGYGARQGVHGRKEVFICIARVKRVITFSYTRVYENYSRQEHR